MKALPGEDPPQDEVTNFEGPGADVAAVVAPQCLLVPCGPERVLAAGLLSEHKIGPPRGILTRLVKRQDPRGTILDLEREDRLGPVDEEE